MSDEQRAEAERLNARLLEVHRVAGEVALDHSPANTSPLDIMRNLRAEVRRLQSLVDFAKENIYEPLLLEEKLGEADQADPTTGHWTRTPPTEPGWYKACSYIGENVELVEVRSEEALGMEPAFQVYVAGWDVPYDLENFDWWWSEPVRLPAPPEEEL